MTEPEYKDKKLTTLNLIKKLKRENPELGDYFERHMSFDDTSKSLIYTGSQSVLKSLVGIE